MSTLRNRQEATASQNDAPVNQQRISKRNENSELSSVSLATKRPALTEINNLPERRIPVTTKFSEEVFAPVLGGFPWLSSSGQPIGACPLNELFVNTQHASTAEPSSASCPTSVNTARSNSDHQQTTHVGPGQNRVAICNSMKERWCPTPAELPTLNRSPDRFDAYLRAEDSACMFYMIHDSMHAAELRHRPKFGYMRRQTDINERMRTILVDWLAEVCDEYQLKSETFYLAVGIVDRFLSLVLVLRDRLQLVGTAAMLIASKIEEIHPPEVRDYMFITDDSCSVEEILKMEVRLLTTLQYQLLKPVPVCFLHVYLVVMGGELDSRLESVSENQLINHLRDLQPSLAGYVIFIQYLCELSLLDSNVCCQYLPSTVAAASASISRHLCGMSPWCAELEKITSYTEADLQACKQDLHRLAASQLASEQKSIFLKYNTYKYHYAPSLFSQSQ